MFSFSTIAIPIYVKHNIQYREGSSGRFELTVGPKQTMGKTVGIHRINIILILLFLFLLARVSCYRKCNA